jgi:uncharacterized protein (DUF983 family)
MNDTVHTDMKPVYLAHGESVKCPRCQGWMFNSAARKGRLICNHCGVYDDGQDPYRTDEDVSK